MTTDYLESVRKQFQYYKMLGDKTFSQLQDDKLFWQHNADSNSIVKLLIIPTTLVKLFLLAKCSLKTAGILSLFLEEIQKLSTTTNSPNPNSADTSPMIS